MPIAPKVRDPNIPQNGNNGQQLSVETLSALSVRFRPILQDIFEGRWFPHTEIFKHVSGPFKNTETILSLVEHWKKGNVVEVNDQSKPDGERKRVFVRFITPLPSVPDNYDTYLTLFKVNEESGNEQARYHGYRIVIHKPKKVDNSGAVWSYVLNYLGEKGGKFCDELFPTELEAKRRAYVKIHKLIIEQNHQLDDQPGES